ncbi:MAG TPA: DUF503 domain-containing protein [Verrucomicrobiae bacterium]|nr:DUF503 domain-containing protein [Verrucomicrobiae bacterium]
MSLETAHIGVLYVEIFIPLSGSLKSKRSVLKSIKDRLRSQFNVSVAEIGERDKWQRSVLAACVVGADKTYLDQCLQSILSFFNNVHDIQLIQHQIEFL